MPADLRVRDIVPASDSTDNFLPSRKSSRIISYGAIAYVAIVLLVDALATKGYKWPAPWYLVHWRLDQLYPYTTHALTSLHLPVGLAAWMRWRALQPFDCFKFLFWFVIPFVCCLPRLDWHWYTTRRWRKIDRWLLAAGAIAGVAILFVIPLFPSLRHYYPSLGNAAHGHRLLIIGTSLVWTLSWLPGWEFLHRYVLVRNASMWRWGWLLVPLSEGAYHLTKSPIEMAGMVVFSIFASWWTVSRRNGLLPFLIHFVIEFGLPVFMVLF